jgi:hypothetical protein
VWTAVAVALAPLTGLLLHWAGTWTILTPTAREDYQLAAAWVATAVVLLGLAEVVVLHGLRAHRATWVVATLGIVLLVVVVVHDLTVAASLASDPDSFSGSLANQVARGVLLAVAAPTTWPLLGLLGVTLRARSNPAPRRRPVRASAPAPRTCG